VRLAVPVRNGEIPRRLAPGGELLKSSGALVGQPGWKHRGPGVRLLWEIRECWTLPASFGRRWPADLRYAPSLASSVKIVPQSPFGASGNSEYSCPTTPFRSQRDFRYHAHLKCCSTRSIGGHFMSVDVAWTSPDQKSGRAILLGFLYQDPSLQICDDSPLKAGLSRGRSPVRAPSPRPEARGDILGIQIE
jgi:hypothetical protein